MKSNITELQRNRWINPNGQTMLGLNVKQKREALYVRLRERALADGYDITDYVWGIIQCHLEDPRPLPGSVETHAQRTERRRAELTAQLAALDAS